MLDDSRDRYRPGMNVWNSQFVIDFIINHWLGISVERKNEGNNKKKEIYKIVQNARYVPGAYGAYYNNAARIYPGVRATCGNELQHL